MCTEQQFDLVILGSGSTAFAAALRAQELGKTSVMTEERTIGGTCVNRGCLPSKNLIEASKIIHDSRHPRYPGLEPCEMKFNFGELVAQKDEVIRVYREKKYDSLVGGQFSIEEGHAEFVDAHMLQVGNKRLRGEKILIATGSRPVVPPIEGLENVPYLTSDLLTHGEATELRELPPSLLIIGGGYIALELAQMFRRFGSEVTILVRGNQLLEHGYEPEVGQSIAEIFQREGIQIVTSAKTKRVSGDERAVTAVVEVSGDVRNYTASKLLVATGRRPNSDQIGIARVGLSVSPDGSIEVNEFLQTTAPHIFAAGDVIARHLDSQMATPVGSQNGGIAAHNALVDEPMRAIDHRVIPRAIFTDPEIGIVGMTEEQVIAAGHQCWCNTVPMSLVPRAGAIRQTSGIIKIVANDQTEEVLGISMVGHNAAEVIHEAAMAIRFRATLSDFVSLLHVYPTMAEALKIAAISKHKDPAKLSCCAE